jgi:hypothetical protein
VTRHAFSMPSISAPMASAMRARFSKSSSARGLLERFYLGVKSGGTSLRSLNAGGSGVPGGDAQGLELGEADLLDHKVAREPGGLDDDGASAIAGNVGEKLCEAGAGVQVISAAHYCVVELPRQVRGRNLARQRDRRNICRR